MLRDVLNAFIKIFALLGASALVAMMVIINVDVLGRYLFNRPLIGTIDIVSTYFMVAIAFFALASVEKNNEHISVDFAVQYVRPDLRLRILAVSCLVSAVFMGGMAWAGWSLAMRKFAVGEYSFGSDSIIIWPARFFVSAGAGLLMIYLLFKAWRLMLGDSEIAEEGADSEGAP